MDCSWLIEDSCNEDEGSESDPEETKAELEARLYSIVHHSDLSQPLPPELAKHYSIQCEDDGKLTVALNDSLENVKSEEIKKVDLIKCLPTNDLNEDSEVSEIECLSGHNDVRTTLNSHNPFKKFRYSDVNLDPDEPRDSSFGEINYSGLNYFKITESFLKKKKVRKLKHLIIPPSFQTDKYPNWKDSANESFISVGADTSESEADIIDKMVFALKKANPKESRGKLYFLARSLFSHNRKKYRQLMKRKQTKTKAVDKTLDSSLEIIREYVSNKPNKSSKNLNENPKNDENDIFKGSVSLNISPFKPLTQTIDLVSDEDEVDSSQPTLENTSFKRITLPKFEIPVKWTKEMTKFYTKPSRRKMKMELNDLFEDLKKNSTADDWRMDPRDMIGIYQRTPQKGKHRNRKCPNCSQRGHLMHECPSPRKIPTCYLCGLNYHQACSCPNKICHKCGIHLTNDAYECSSCYYNTFNYEIPCELCGKVTHRTEICPDLWRSFHATVDGNKKIPENVKENKRKYCCNCATKGHFSHQCPYSSCDGDNISSFVTNYSASQFEAGTTNIVIPHRLSHIIENAEADKFFQELSNSTNAVIDVEEDKSNYIFRVSGTFDQCRQVKDEVEEFVNTRKRKRQDPCPRKKRRKFF